MNFEIINIQVTPCSWPSPAFNGLTQNAITENGHHAPYNGEIRLAAANRCTSKIRKIPAIALCLTGLPIASAYRIFLRAPLPDRLRLLKLTIALNVESRARSAVVYQSIKALG